MTDWRDDLRMYRERAKLSREGLADITGISAASIKAYEQGVRRPTQQSLAKLLDALSMDRDERERVMTGAGFASDAPTLDELRERERYSPADAVRSIERFRWPAFVTDSNTGVVGANAAAQRLWGVDLRTEFQDDVDRNLLIVASDPRFADRCLNWDEAVARIARAWKVRDIGHETLDEPSPYLNLLLQRFMQGDARYVTRFFKIFEQAPDVWDEKLRWTYPIVWDEPGIGVMRFEALVSTADDKTNLAFNDWIPLDADTWDRLEALERRDSSASDLAGGRNGRDAAS